jgi:hypothetical protein
MRQHAWEYGFIGSYPPKRQDVSCYASEAWHYRYVGRTLAAAIHASGLTTREYLWANFTTAVVPAVTPKPTKEPRATGSPAASPSIAPSSPTMEPSAAPSGSDGASGPPVERETPGGPDASSSRSGAPEASRIPIDASPVTDLDPAVAAGVAIALLGVLLGAVLVLRRGRSGVGL